MISNQIPSSSKTIEDTNAFSDELDVHPLGVSKLLQGLPKSEAFTGYKVQIDEVNYFALDGFTLRLNGKEIRIFNLRSIRGHIGIDFTRKGDKSLGKIVHDYLTHGDNVELLNILSRELNDFNWFEAYSDDFINLDVHTKEELMGMENSGSMIIPHGGMISRKEINRSNDRLMISSILKSLKLKFVLNAAKMDIYFLKHS